MSRFSSLVYRWEDGSYAHVDWWSLPSQEMRKFMFTSMTMKDPYVQVSFNPWMPSEDRMFQCFVPDEWRAKMAGFLMDLGGKQNFALGPDPSPHTSPYPVWMSNEDWENRAHVLAKGKLVEKELEESDYLAPVSGLRESRVLPGEWYIYVLSADDWRFVTGPKCSHFKRLPAKTGKYGLPFVLRAKSQQKLVDKICSYYHILPESKREWWERTQIERGTFVLPSPEEVEVFRILEEELPLLWPPETFEPWIETNQG